MKYRGYTLIELMVSLSVFAVVMTIAAGGYFIMISVNRHAQGIATGIDNLSFALDNMTRSVRPGTNYLCDGATDCGFGGSTFSFTDQDGNQVTYQLSGTTIQSVENGNTYDLTEPAVSVSTLTFYLIGASRSDATQSHVKIVINGSVNVGPGVTEPFTIETMATMRGSDL